MYQSGCFAFCQIDSRQMRHGRARRQQPLLPVRFSQLLKRDGLIDAERSYGQPPQAAQMGATPKNLAQVVCNRSHVGSGTARDPNSDHIVVKFQQCELVNGHRPRIQYDLFTTARPLVLSLAVTFDG